MSFQLKNYTSSVAPSLTIAKIESYLAECGVSGVSKKFEDGRCVAILFHVDLVEHGKFTIRLPARVEEVQQFLWEAYLKETRRHRKTIRDFKDQAERTAWRIQQDWVQVQMSMIKLKQADFLQVFMGFVWDGQTSYYERIADRGSLNELSAQNA